MTQYSFTPRPIQKDKYFRGSSSGSIHHNRRLEPWMIALIAVGAALVLAAIVFCVLYFTGAGAALAPVQEVLPLPSVQPSPTPEAVDAALVISATDTNTTVLPGEEEATPSDAATGTNMGGYVYQPGDLVAALTFDDGPHSTRTNNVLDILEQYGVPATFFVQGKSVSGNESTLQRALDLGCEIGNHSWDHPNYNKMSEEEIRSQIDRTNDAVEAAVGVRPAVVRPPYGNADPDHRQYIDYPIILWSIDTLDWKTHDADNTFNVTMNEIKCGSIVLMHDIHEQTAPAVAKIVPSLIDKGYHLVTVSQLLEIAGGGEAHVRYRSVDLS